MAVNFYQTIFQKVNTSLNTFIGSTTESVISSIHPTTITLLTIYVMLWGWSTMRGVIDEPITDGVTRIIKLTIIVTLALSLGHYSSFISEWVYNTPDTLSNRLLGVTQGSSLLFLDSLLEKYFDLASAYLSKATENATFGIPDLTLFVCGIFIYISAVCVTGYGAFLMLLSKMALAVLLGVGPIFIVLAIFEATKKFLDAWIGQLCNYIFLIILVASVCRLLLTLLSVYITQIQPDWRGDHGIADAVQLIVLSTISFLVLMQTPSIASALGGGAAISTLGAVGAAWSKFKGAANGASNIVSGKTLTDIRANRKRKAQMGEWAKNNPLIRQKTKADKSPQNSIRKQ